MWDYFGLILLGIFTATICNKLYSGFGIYVLLSFVLLVVGFVGLDYHYKFFSFMFAFFPTILILNSFTHIYGSVRIGFQLCRVETENLEFAVNQQIIHIHRGIHKTGYKTKKQELVLNKLRSYLNNKNKVIIEIAEDYFDDPEPILEDFG